jgi:hypothetical protein
MLNSLSTGTTYLRKPFYKGRAIGRKAVSEPVCQEIVALERASFKDIEIMGEETRQQSLIERVEWGRNEETKERERERKREGERKKI